MILDRIVIAGLAWTGRTLVSSKLFRGHTGEPGRERSPMRQAAEEEAPQEGAPVETQQVIAPDQDLLESFNPDESMGYRGNR
jgi:hypothetical protein